MCRKGTKKIRRYADLCGLMGWRLLVVFHLVINDVL